MKTNLNAYRQTAIAAGQDLEQTLESVMLPEYSDWLLYEVRREALVADIYRFQTQ
jgi:hypothetical protein|tara:strand:+ start:4143 stop:4307 length:165 start_codon:yes stop_codon:yes gene_type:complete